MWPLYAHSLPARLRSLTSSHSSSSRSAPLTAHATALAQSSTVDKQVVKLARLTNALLLKTGLELQDLCEVPSAYWVLLEPAGDDDEVMHRPGRTDVVDRKEAQDVIRRPVRFVVRIKEWERTLFADIYVLGQPDRQGWDWYSKAGGERDGKSREVFEKWARTEEREAEIQAWVEEASVLGDMAEGLLLRWSGSTGVEVGGGRGARRRRTFEGIFV